MKMLHAYQYRISLLISNVKAVKNLELTDRIHQNTLVVRQR